MADKVFDGVGMFALFCDEQALEIPERVYAAALFSADMLKTSIKKVYGDPSELEALSQTTLDLSPSREGGPLLVDGSKLRDSIQSHAEMTGPESAFATTGSPEPLVASHEHGYVTADTSMIPGKTVPPRPAFAIGVYKGLPEVIKVVQALLGRNYSVRGTGNKFASLAKGGEGLTENAGDLANRLGS